MTWLDCWRPGKGLAERSYPSLQVLPCQTQLHRVIMSCAMGPGNRKKVGREVTYTRPRAPVWSYAPYQSGFSSEKHNRMLLCVGLACVTEGWEVCDMSQPIQARAQKSWVVTWSRGLRAREANIGNLIPREGEREMERANSDSESWSWVWWRTPTVSGHVRLRWKNHEFKAALSYVINVRPASATLSGHPSPKVREEKIAGNLLFFHFWFSSCP